MAFGHEGQGGRAWLQEVAAPWGQLTCPGWIPVTISVVIMVWLLKQWHMADPCTNVSRATLLMIQTPALSVLFSSSVSGAALCSLPLPHILSLLSPFHEGMEGWGSCWCVERALAARSLLRMKPRHKHMRPVVFQGLSGWHPSPAEQQSCFWKVTLGRCWGTRSTWSLNYHLSPKLSLLCQNVHVGKVLQESTGTTYAF